MRTIKFRAKSSSEGWVYGNFIHSKRFQGSSNEFRIHNQETGLESDIIFETLGQFTGFYDKNGTEIYEGDILSDWEETEEGLAQSFQQVYWCSENGQWHLYHSYLQDRKAGSPLYEELKDFDYEVTGNVFDNKK